MIGEKIRVLRKARRLTQEQLAEHLNVSPQAVSKWETGLSSPDIDMLPRLAAFFGTSVDDLLDFDRRRLDEEVDRLVRESVPLREDPAKAEAFYRDALKRYPGNEVLLNCLLAVIPDDRAQEKIAIGEQLLDTTQDDEVRLDTLRLLALTCRRAGQPAMAEAYLSRLPELYFLKTEIAAAVRSGDARAKEVEKTETICLWTLGAMLKLREADAASVKERTRLQSLRAAYLDLFAASPDHSERARRIAARLEETAPEDLYQ